MTLGRSFTAIVNFFNSPPSNGVADMGKEGDGTITGKYPGMPWIIACLLALIASHLVYNYCQPSLASIPGPFAAGCTDLWRLHKVWQWRFKEDLPALHRAYNSSVIRIGPSMVSCSDPRAVELIYGFHTDFKKVSQSPTPILSDFVVWGDCDKADLGGPTVGYGQGHGADIQGEEAANDVCGG